METLFDTPFSCNTSTFSIFQVKKLKTPSIIHKQAQKKRKMKRDEVKKKKI
jgi:hypothetical protein